MSAAHRTALLLFALWAILCTGRIAGPPDLIDNDQQRPAMYVLDARLNGNWISQRDQTGDVTSKPPLYTWIAAAATYAAGTRSTLALYGPTALFTLGTGLMCAVAISRYRDMTTALLAGGFWLLSVPAMKYIALARTDPLFALCVAGAALSAFSAAREGRSWVWFYLWAALATLAKGPLGIALGAMGLLGLWGIGGSRRGPLWQHAAGAALLLALAGGWFAAAHAVQGQDLIDKMIGRELVGHASVAGEGEPFGPQLPKPTLYFLSRFAPWSLLAFAGLWKAFRRPDPDPRQRALERFLGAWLLGGIVLFSIPQHQRPDHLAPLLPAGAMLAALAAGPWAARRAKAIGIALAVAAVALAAGDAWSRWRRAESDWRVADSIVAKDAARTLLAGFAPHSAPRLHFGDAPAAIQFWMGRMQPRLDASEVARVLAAQEPAWAVVEDPGRVRALLPEGASMHVLREWRATVPKRTGESAHTVAVLVANVPELPGSTIPSVARVGDRSGATGAVGIAVLGALLALWAAHGMARASRERAGPPA